MQLYVMVSWLVFFGAVQATLAADFFNRAIPDEFKLRMTQMANAGQVLKFIAFAPNRGWSILAQ